MINPELALKIVKTSPTIVYDSETSGLRHGIDFICGHVITDKDNSLYIPIRHEAGGNIPNGNEFNVALNDAFAERSRLGLRTVGHNLGFDLRMLSWEDIIPGGPLEDTQINEAIIDDRTLGYGLEDCCKRHQVTPKLGADLYRVIAERFGGVPDRKQMANYWRMPGDDPYVVDYATGDGISTLELWKSQQSILDEEDLRVPWQLECDLLPYVARLHRRGMLVDADYAARINDDVKSQIEEASKIFPAGINVRSPSDLENLYRDNGFTDDQFDRTKPSKRYPEGQLSFTEKWLETNEIGDKILIIRRLMKARDSFIAPLIDTHNINGRVHPVLNQSKNDEYGVAGSRFSCSEPNLQAFPKRNKVVGRLVRKLVVPDGDMLIEEGDAMQQEPRFFTHYSEEPSLIEGYTKGTYDIHDVANKKLGLDERDKAKRLGLGMLTMMSPPTLAMHMRIGLSEAKELHRAFLGDAFPYINQFQQDVISVFRNRGYVKSILGRKARLDDRRFAYKGVSRIIQNSGGDHIKTCLLRAMQYEDAYSEFIQMLMTIHDSIIWQRDPDHSPKELVRIIENVPHEPQFNLTVPIPFEVGSGRHWAEASYDGEIKGKKGWLI